MGSFLAILSVLSALFGWAGGTDECAVREKQGAAAVRQIQEDWPLRGSADPVTWYVRELGGRLVQAAGIRGNQRWQFLVVRNLAPTAFALGGKSFVVSDGLLALVRNESEFAAVLAHELAHEQAGHFCRRAPRTTERFRVGSLVQHYEAEAEAEADAIAVGLLRAAGFDPRAMESVLRCILSRSPTAEGVGLGGRIAKLADRALPDTDQVFVDSYAFGAARERVTADFGEAAGGDPSGQLGPCR